MSNRKIAILFTKINGEEKIRIYSGEGKVHTIEGKSISEFAKKNGKASIEELECKLKLNKIVRNINDYDKNEE